MPWNLHRFVAFLLLLFTAQAAADEPMKVFSVLDFGAVADGKTDSSKAFLEAWNGACAWDGQGRVVVPKGTFLVGPVGFSGPCKGSITFQLSGVMKAPGELDRFPSESWVEFRYLSNLLLTGGGTFHGQGALAWPHNDCSQSDNCKPLPTSLRLSFVNDSTIRGISSIDSKQFHVVVFQCYGIKFINVNISAPAESPNTDGIHIGNSARVSISRSRIGTGDDCVSIGPGSTDVSVSDVFCGPGHGISVGSLGKYLDDKDVRNVTVRNCTLSNTDNGLRIKTWPDSTDMSATNFTFKDVVMRNVRFPIFIDQLYCPRSDCTHKNPSRVQISDIRFDNIRGTSATQVAINLVCSKEKPCQNLMMNDVDLQYNGPEGPAQALCVNTKGISTGSQSPPSCL
ncbi:hypothetical protein ACLOJK_000487 [Asimina triloba]